MPAASESLKTSAPLHCIVCDLSSQAADVKTARIRSNVRKFAGETFALWQCPGCGSIHAADEVDLAHYYAHYPFHNQKLNVFARLSYMGKVHELAKLGLKREHRVLDYGSGGGVFVDVLKEEGFTHARGYDPYATSEESRKHPGNGWDVILSQDVIEHVDNPIEHLRTLKELAVPGALLVIGTPNGAIIDLNDPAEWIHMLHQPYHRHILSAETIGKLAGSLGMQVVKVHYGFIGNRGFPGLNGPYLRRILRAQGDILDDMVEGNIPKSLSLFTPAAIWDALTGSLHDPGNDMTVVLRTPLL